MNQQATNAQFTQRRLTSSRAMCEAIAHEMRVDPGVFVMGEDVAALGGVFDNTQGLLEEFGPERVRDTPISETAFIGAAVGAATAGLRPIVDLMFVDFLGVCFDPIFNLAAKNNYFSGGVVNVPMVLTTAIGGGYGDAGQHSEVLYATFAHMPGLKIVSPSNAYDAKGLMTTAIRDLNPVIYMYHKGLQGLGWLPTETGAMTAVPEEDYSIPFGRAAVKRHGKDVTVVALGMMVHRALEAAQTLAEAGIESEVIDLRSIVPLDIETIINSVNKTKRLVVIDEDYRNCGVPAEIIAEIAERDPGVFSAPPRRVTYPDIPIPFQPGAGAPCFARYSTYS